jgi:hypothetical protein
MLGLAIQPAMLKWRKPGISGFEMRSCPISPPLSGSASCAIPERFPDSCHPIFVVNLLHQ